MSRKLNTLQITDKNFGIVLFQTGYFGGAEKRFSNLFHYLYNKYNAKIHFIVNASLYDSLQKILPEIICENIHVIGKKIDPKQNTKNKTNPSNKTFTNSFSNVLKNEDSFSLTRKTYLFIKNYYQQYMLFRQIEKIRLFNKIDVFMGVYSGTIPLYFYKRKKQRPGLIFSDMDSWFYEIHPNKHKYWYRKYFSFNYALNNFDNLDFLSPFILKGVEELGVKLNHSKCNITPCSFIDYSKCIIGKKENLEIAFAGRLEESKNPLLYIESINILSKKYPNIKFHLLGNGNLSDTILDLIKSYSLQEKINFCFHVNPPEVFSNTSIFVSLQTTNNYPSQSVLEAMACGNAIIATDVGDTRLFVNDTNGILINLGLNELLNALDYLINNKEKTLQLGLSGRKYALENHNLEKHANYYWELFIKSMNKLT